MEAKSPSPEWKKISAELLILSLVEARARHGYEISKVIEQRSGGTVRFYVTSLYPLLYRLEKRGWIQGRWVEKAHGAALGSCPASLLSQSPFFPQSFTTIFTHERASFW
jgi:hypothetical protein